MNSNAASTRPRQSLLSTLLLSVTVLTCLAVAVAAHFTPVFANHVSRELDRQRAVNGMYFYNGGYLDDGDYVLIDQLPSADYSRGGVYFIGASETKISIRPWELPAAERALIHNYSLGDLRHSDVLHFVRSLVEDDGLLAAGPDKTTIVLGLSYQMARTRDLAYAPHRYVPELFQRHGMYRYDVADGIQRKPMSALEIFLRKERVRAGRYLQVLFSPPDKVRNLHDTPQDMREYLVNQMGPDWRPEMERQVGYVADVIDYLQARGANVCVIFPPEGSWHDSLPFDESYRTLLAETFRKRNVRVYDLKDLLPDNDFGDAVHARYSGEMQLHKAYHHIALKALADMGVMSKSLD